MKSGHEIQAQVISPADARTIAREACICGYPMVDSYRLYTYNFDYIGSCVSCNEGGSIFVAGLKKLTSSIGKKA